MRTLSKNMAFTYAPMGIRCNAIVTGGVKTHIMTASDMSLADMEALGQYGKWHAVMPMTLEADDIARLALLLASDEAKRMNGALVAADGGWGAAG